MPEYRTIPVTTSMSSLLVSRGFFRDEFDSANDQAAGAQPLG